MDIRKGTSKDIEGVLALQDKNLYGKMTPSERLDGFVTTPFVPSLIETVIEQNGLFIAVDKGQVIAYAFAGTWAFFEQWAIFQLMSSRLPMLSFNNQPLTTLNSFQYGPVCIAKEYRGQGLLPQLFEVLRLAYVSQYPVSMTFINKVNGVSEKAHAKLGWQIVDEFDFNNKRYLGLALDMGRSVIGE